LPADAYLGSISGLGGRAADFTVPGNLTALVFVPVSNSGSPPDDQNASQICGPNGAILRTTTGTASSVVTDTTGTTITFGTTSLVVNAAAIVLTAGGKTFTWAATGAISEVAITAPDVILPNGAVNTHVHGGVESGSDETDFMTS
jgi:hypothetical protein